MLPQLADRHSSCTLSQFEKYLLLTELRGEGLPKNRASILREMRNVSGRRKPTIVTDCHILLEEGH